MNKEQLKKEILQAVENGDIAKLYVLEQNASDIFEESMLLDYYKNILDLALERLTDLLEAKSVFDMEDVQDAATVRALYEYAIEHYHAGKTEDAASLFEILAGITNDKKFSKAMEVHTAAAKNGVELEKFLDEYADMEAVERSGNFYIADFTKKARFLLDDLHKERAL